MIFCYPSTKGRLSLFLCVHSTLAFLCLSLSVSAYCIYMRGWCTCLSRIDRYHIHCLLKNISCPCKFFFLSRNIIASVTTVRVRVSLSLCSSRLFYLFTSRYISLTRSELNNDYYRCLMWTMDFSSSFFFFTAHVTSHLTFLFRWPRWDKKRNRWPWNEKNRCPWSLQRKSINRLHLGAHLYHWRPLVALMYYVHTRLLKLQLMHIKQITFKLSRSRWLFFVRRFFSQSHHTFCLLCLSRWHCRCLSTGLSVSHPR